MDTTITGKAFVLGDDVDTDQIIPAQYLSYDPTDPEERKYFGMYACCGVPPDQSGLPEGQVRFVPDGCSQSEFTILIAGKNFGCGSSREHAPLAIAEAGVHIVIAEFYARIFFRNCVNGGYLLPFETKHRLADQICTGDVCTVDTPALTLTNQTQNQTFALNSLGEAGPIIEAGGVFDYARASGMLE